MAAGTGSKPRFGFVRNVIAELKKVAWPSRDEAIRLTGIVLTVTAVVAIVLGLIDMAFARLAEAFLL